MSTKKRCVIISGSPVFEKTEINSDDYIIACDYGCYHANESGIVPDIAIGDFDSYNGTFSEKTEIIKAPAEKDETDTMLAVEYAIKKGINDFLILGATGGRIDHQLANFSTAAYIADKGGSCVIKDAENIIYAIKNRKLVLNKADNYSVSVFSFSDVSKGVTLKGVKYPLENHTLYNIFPLGMSNEFAGETAEIEVKSGILLVVLSYLK